MSHRYNNGKNTGKNWLSGFVNRHPDLALRRLISTTIDRAMDFTKPECAVSIIRLQKNEKKIA